MNHDMNMKAQVKRLLMHNQENFSTSPDLALFDVEESDFDSTRPLPIKQIKDIYGVRAQINQRKGSPILGFEELLGSLEVSDEECICVHSLTKSNHQLCVVFTDASLKKVFGVLTWPTSKLHTETETLAASAA